MPSKKESISLGKKFTRWNTNKKNGWDTYFRLSNSNIKLDQIAESETIDVDIIMNKIEKELNAVKYKSFGKVKMKKKKKDERIEELLAEKSNALSKYSEDPIDVDERIKHIDKEIAYELKTKQMREVENEIDNLNKIKEAKGTAATVSTIKESIIGKKKDSDEPCVVIDPKTNKLVFKPSEILKVCADYVKNLLTNREPREGFEKDLQWKHRVHDVRMKEHVEGDVEFSTEMLDKTLEELKRKGGGKYDFILKGGKSLKNALFKLYKTVWNEEKKPDSWRDTVIIQLFKGRGLRTDLNNRRHLHTKPEVQKVFSHMVTSVIKPLIVENIPPSQIGAVPGHRAQEHLFTIKTFIARR